MNVLVIGSGGREHALAWKFSQSTEVAKIICTPGNGGTASLNKCQNLDIAVDDFSRIAAAIATHKVDLVVVGPELPLSLGISDYLQQHTAAHIFGPTKLGAQLEASKSWAKALMHNAGIPTAAGVTFTNLRDAQSYLKSQKAPIVVKADGLAAGKGVTVASTITAAQEAVAALFASEHPRVVIEEYLTGQEVSILALTDGLTIRPLLAAQDHKRIGEGDTGKNTGGMGAYAPAPLVDQDLSQKIEEQVLQPVLRELQKSQIDYRGVIYAGLMITAAQEIKVLEFNCRFGDPETQAILPLLSTPLEELLLACATQKLSSLPPITWYPGASVCVIISAAGYPDSYPTGMPIAGIERAEKAGAIVFHSGTKPQNGRLVASGGRVLGVTATDVDFSTALQKVYQGVNLIDFEPKYYRRDIGHHLTQ